MTDDLFPGFNAGKIELFRPTTETVEGKKFFEDYCEKCGWKAREEDEEECRTLELALTRPVDHPEYPYDLIYKKFGPPDEVQARVPVCNKFRPRLY